MDKHLKALLIILCIPLTYLGVAAYTQQVAVADLPEAQPVKHDQMVRRMVFTECLRRIQSIKDQDEWSIAVKDCGDIARWESSI
jgi:hypothetical protein